MIVDYCYYIAKYDGMEVDETDFCRLYFRAYSAVTALTRGRAAEYDKLPAVWQEAIRTAVCAQIEYYALNGAEAAVDENTAESFTVGNVRVDSGGSRSRIAPAAREVLELCGLAYAGVCVC